MTTTSHDRAPVPADAAPQSLRPRVGLLHRVDGEAVPLVIHPTVDPLVFEAESVRGQDLRPLDEGDLIWVDSLAPQQRVAVAHVPLDNRQVRRRDLERGETDPQRVVGPAQSPF